MKNLTCYTILLGLAATLACPALAQTLDVRLVEELRIGADETRPVEYLLQEPQELAVDGEGRRTRRLNLENNNTETP